MDAGNSEYTKLKQADVAYYLAAHMDVVKKIIAKYAPQKPYMHGRYVYIDFNAGPGYIGTMKGSPAIAIEVADGRQLPTDFWFCERDAESARQLRALFGQRPDVHILQGDHHETYRTIMAYYRSKHLLYGIIYFDSNGELIPVETLQALIKSPFQMIDLLLHINAAGAYKRRRRFHPARFLLDDLRQLGKAQLKIRSKREHWQWTLIVSSNYENIPSGGALDMVDADSPAGRARMEHFNYSKDELREKLQGRLDLDPPSDDDEPPTEPMPNTSPTPDSGPFAPASWPAPKDAANAADDE